MEELGSMWTYQQGVELKQKLLYTTLELESLKTEANEEIRKNKENIRNLLNLLKTAYQERDEARNQLQKFMNKLIPANQIELPNILPHNPNPESPIVIPTKPNSSITESNSLSETYNQTGSSPVDSSYFFDAVSSPEYFSNINNISDSSNQKIDPVSGLIDNFVKGKKLPQKGKLLQAVMESGPLLQTLLVAGPLPQWRNPPPLQPFKIPPVSINGCDSENFNQKRDSKPGFVVQKKLNYSSSQFQNCSASLLNFNGGASGYCANSVNSQIPAGKRKISMID